MGVFENFPYSNFHDLNLDWILNAIKELAAKVESFSEELETFPETVKPTLEQILEEWNYIPLPIVDYADDGKVLAVVAGHWGTADVPNGNLPAISAIDVGKILRVSDEGVWTPSTYDDITGSYKVISEYQQRRGIISSQGKWTNITSGTYQYILLEVSGGESLQMKGNADRTLYYAALRSWNNPINNDNADFASGWTSRRQLSAGANVFLTLPSDARYVFVQTMGSGSLSTVPQALRLNDYDVATAAMSDSLVDYLTRQTVASEINQFRAEGIDAPLKWELGTIKTSDGVGRPTQDQASSTRWRTDRPYKTDVDLTVITNNAFSLQIIYLENDGVTLKALDPNNPAHRSPLTIPGGSYFRIIIGYTNGDPVGGLTITDYITVKYTGIADILYPTGVSWVVLGDSIPEGYYSFMNGSVPASALNASWSWVSKVAALNKWPVNNLADGGTGFLDEDDHQSAGWKIANATDFSSYNLVTIAYGINDWKGNQTLGTLTADPSQLPTTPTTVLQAMQIMIEKILSDNPNVKIYGILPINCSAYGDYADNYSLGTANSLGVTLDDFCTALESVYTFYGIEIIDMAHVSVIGRGNITSLLLDGVHPTPACHTLMARELSKKILF